jgi:hypothetical protein
MPLKRSLCVLSVFQRTDNPSSHVWRELGL